MFPPRKIAKKQTYRLYMKKKISILCVCIILLSCTNNKQAINSKDLQGKYEVDFSSLLQEMGDEDDSYGVAFAALLLSSIKMTIQFDGDKMIVDGSGAAVNFVNAFSEDGTILPFSTDYQIKNDSILYTRTGSEDFKKAGVLRKMGESYDYLQFVADEDNEKGTEVLTLRKMSE